MSRVHVGERLRRPALVLAIAVACAAVQATAGVAQSAGASETCPPNARAGTTAGAASGGTPGKLVACVGSQSITAAAFEHWAAIARKEEHATSTKPVLREVAGFLISAAWVTKEAADLGIHVTGGEVRAKFNQIRKQQFPKKSELVAVLRRTGQSVADLMFRVRLNLLSQRVQKRAVAGHHGASAQERALAKFIIAFKRKWRAKTYCVELFAAVRDCGHVQASV